MADPLFEGFTRPQANFYRLPITWFDTLRILREQQNRRRIVALVRLTEYVIKWTWGQGNFERPVHLTLDELQNGKVLKRQNGRKIRADRGTGLPRKTLIPTIEDAIAYGLLERNVDAGDRARIRHEYGIRLAPEASSTEDESFNGFPNPTSNYFIVPNLWTDLTAGVRSDVLILAVEYLFRHCWNWSRRDEVHWLTSDEIANGRLYAQESAGTASPERYDAGIGYSERKVRDALAAAVEHEWVVWRTSHVDGRARSEYTLRRLGWPPGLWQEAPASGPTGPTATPSGPKVTSGGPNVTADGPIVTPEGPKSTTTDNPKVTPGGPNVTVERPNVTPAGPKVTPGGPKVDLDQLYQPTIPTTATNSINPPPPTTALHITDSARAGHGGGALSVPDNIQAKTKSGHDRIADRKDASIGEPLTDNGREKSNNAQWRSATAAAVLQPALTPRIQLDFVAPQSGMRLAVSGPGWPSAWPAGALLTADYVLVQDPEDVRQVAILSTQDVAELLWAGLPRSWICWNPAWLAAEPGTDLYGELWDEAAARRENAVDDLLAIMQNNQDRWGHWDLLEALRRYGLAPERSQALLAQYGRPLVGAWLADIRQDPTVQSVPAVLISNLRKGLTPPGLARRLPSGMAR